MIDVLFKPSDRCTDGIIYNDSLYTTDLYISAYNILVCETIVDQDQQRL